MTLRDVLHALVTDDVGREALLRDPAAVLAREGFDDIDVDLLGTALIHYADRADPAEFDDLIPLLERYGPLAALASTEDGSGDVLVDVPGDVADLDGAPEIDPASVLDDLDVDDGLDVPTDHGWDFGTGAVPAVAAPGDAESDAESDTPTERAELGWDLGPDPDAAIDPELTSGAEDHHSTGRTDSDDADRSADEDDLDPLD